ncbi:MAG TPA: RNA polymerase sigma factor [Thermoanaerobaculia bacterium]|nr:RNA polymerase sigma factor [Thermoanaerobaculia bacterium]
MPGRQQPQPPSGPPRSDGQDLEKRDRECLRLYRRYGGILLKFFLNRHLPADDAADLLHETFVSVLNGFDQLRSQDREEPWLFKVALRTFLGWRRRTKSIKRDAPVLPLDDELEEALIERAPVETWEPASPLGELLVEERHARARDEIARLPEIYQQPLMMLLSQDRSYEEIAAALQIPLGTVKSRINEAKKRLHAILGEDRDP